MDGPADSAALTPPSRRRLRASWAFGVLLFLGVVLVTAHWSEQRALARLLEAAEPAWIALAVALQALTYLAQAGVWQVVLVRARERASLWHLYRMSVAKLFVDQAIPSAGVSGTLLIIRGLRSRGVARGPVMACVVVETVTNFSAFVLALLLALALAAGFGDAAGVVWGAAAGFIAFALGAIALLAYVSRGRRLKVPALLLRLPGMGALLDALADAPPALAHRPRILAEATALNFAIHLLDAGTLWALLMAVGTHVPVVTVFVAFMLSTLARTVGVVPGGLGTFEAGAIGGLALGGVPTHAALAATLLFRGVSFWAPLLPGLLLSRAEVDGPPVEPAHKA